MTFSGLAISVSPRESARRSGRMREPGAVNGGKLRAVEQPLEKLRDEDSNLDYLIQSQASYH